MLPAVLDQTILATALPTIAADLGRLADVSWVVTAYVVAAAATTPLWGKLGDRHGRKRLLEVSLALFLAASARVRRRPRACSMLVVARGIQGAAAGGLMTLAMAAVGDLVSPRERGRYQGYIAATFAVATVVGPLLGGAARRPRELALGVLRQPARSASLALAGLHLRLPASRGRAPSARGSTCSGAVLLAAGDGGAACSPASGAASATRWGSAEIVGAARATVALAAGARRARASRRRTRSCRSACCATARRRAGERGAVPRHRDAVLDHRVRPAVPADHDGRDPDPGRAAARPDDGRDHALDQPRRPRDRADRPLQALPGRGPGADDRWRWSAGGGRRRIRRESPPGSALAVFGLGFGMVGQVLIIAVQNGVDRRRARRRHGRDTSFFRGARRRRRGGRARRGVRRPRRAPPAAERWPSPHAGRSEVIDGVHTVFLLATPAALIALLTVLALKEVPLRGPDRPASQPSQPAQPSPAATAGAAR